LAFAPETWKKFQYRNLESPDAIPFKQAFGTSYYEYLFKDKPHLGTEFHRAMEALTAVAVADIASRFPFEKILKTNNSSSEPTVMVDVGGGRGQVVNRIWMKMSNDLVRFIVQDLNYDTSLEGLEYQ
jgi:hypothetical protein